jgi:hypothetical protein
VGNWELTAAVAIRQGIPITVIYAPSKNPFIDRMLRGRREALGCGLVSLEEGARPLMRELAGGRSVGLVVDTRDDDGVPVPFFGLDKLTTLAPARLALRFGCELIPGRVERLGPARFRLTAHAPIRPDPALKSDREQAIQMMAELNRLFEQWIRERPEQWLCMKRAWPKSVEQPPGHAMATRADWRGRRQGSGLDADSLEVGRDGDLEYFEVVGIVEHPVPDSGLLVHAVARLERTLADTFELGAHPALEHVHHLEVQAVRVLVAGPVARLARADHLGEHLACGRRIDAQITVGEMLAQTDLPVGPFGLGNVEAALGEARIERLRGLRGRCGRGHP